MAQSWHTSGIEPFRLYGLLVLFWVKSEKSDDAVWHFGFFIILVSEKTLNFLLPLILKVKGQIKCFGTGIHDFVVVGEFPYICIEFGAVIFL